MNENAIEPIRPICKTVGGTTEVMVPFFPPRIGVTLRFLDDALCEYVQYSGGTVTFTPSNGWARYKVVKYTPDMTSVICELVDSELAGGAE